MNFLFGMLGRNQPFSVQIAATAIWGVILWVGAFVYYRWIAPPKDDKDETKKP